MSEPNQIDVSRVKYLAEVLCFPYRERAEAELLSLIDTIRAESHSDLHGRMKPVAWLHTLHMERGQKIRSVSLDRKHKFGRRGEEYDPTFHVTSEPLYPSPHSPIERFEDGAREGLEK